MGIGDKLAQKMHLNSTHSATHKSTSTDSHSYSTTAAHLSPPEQRQQPNQNELAGNEFVQNTPRSKLLPGVQEESKHELASEDFPRTPAIPTGQPNYYTGGQHHTLQPQMQYESDVAKPQQPTSTEIPSKFAASTISPTELPSSGKEYSPPKVVGAGAIGDTHSRGGLEDAPAFGRGGNDKLAPPDAERVHTSDSSKIGLDRPAVANTDVSASRAPQGFTAQAQGKVQPYVEMVQPYVEKVKQTSQPVVDKVAEVGSAVAQRAQPAVRQVQEASQPLLESAGAASQRIGEVSREKATQAYNAAAAELDRRGVTRETSQQKVADIGQAMKDYSVVGQDRAGQYLQQAVDKAYTIGKDGEAQSIFAKILGTIALVWLAFGFSLTALFAFGVAAVIAMILSRFTGRSLASQGRQTHQVPEHASSSRPATRTDASPISDVISGGSQRHPISDVQTNQPGSIHLPAGTTLN